MRREMSLSMRKCNYSGFALKTHTGLETQDNVRTTQTETEVSSSWMSGRTENGKREWERESDRQIVRKKSDKIKGKSV